MPDDRDEEGTDRPTDGEDDGQGSQWPMDGKTVPSDEPVKVTPVKVVRWVPKAASQPLQGQAPGEQGGHPSQETGEGAPAPFEVVEEGEDHPVPFEVVGEAEDGPLPFVVMGAIDGPPAQPGEEGVFLVVDDPEVAFTEVVNDGEGDKGGGPPPFVEEVEMVDGLELRDEQSTTDQASGLRRSKGPAPPGPETPTGGPNLTQPPVGPARQAPPPTIRGIPMARPPGPLERAPPSARSVAPPSRPLPRSPATREMAPMTRGEVQPLRASPQPARVPPPQVADEPGYAKYFRPDEDAIRPSEQGPPAGFDRDLETEAGETDIGIELDRPADKWKRGKTPPRAAKEAKKPGQRTVGGRDMDSEVGTRDVGPDIGVSFESRRRRRL